MGLKIIIDNCVGCGICIKACPFDALELVDDKAVVNDNCTLCGICISTCKFDALELPESDRTGSVNTDEYRQGRYIKTGDKYLKAVSPDKYSQPSSKFLIYTIPNRLSRIRPVTTGGYGMTACNARIAKKLMRPSPGRYPRPITETFRYKMS